MEEEKVYPSPLALHEEVISNRAVFMDTLLKFHSTLGTRFMNPVVGGKDLDLHLLYGEITKRGGFEKVYKEKKMKEVISAFDFPPTTTSAAYVLRKYYLSLLHHYEQVYFFRLQGKLVTSAVPIPVKKRYRKPKMPSATESSSKSMKLNQQQQEQMVCKREEAFSSQKTRVKTQLCKPMMAHVNDSPPDSMPLPLQLLRGECFSSQETGVRVPLKNSLFRTTMPTVMESVRESLQLILQQHQQMMCMRGEDFSSPKTRAINISTMPDPIRTPPRKLVMHHVNDSPLDKMQLPLQQQQQQMVCTRGEAFSSPEIGVPVPVPVKNPFCKPTMPSETESPLELMQLNLHQQQQMACKRGKAFSSPKPRVPVPVKTPLYKPAMPYANDSPPDSVQLSLQQQQQVVCKSGEAFPSQKRGAPSNFTVVGVIDGKFDDGYFVKVTVGSEILRGVLYHISPLDTDSTSLPTPNNAIVPSVPPSDLQQKRKRRKRMHDPDLPKLNQTAYNFFFAEKHPMLKLLCPQTSEREIIKMIGEAWNKITAEERMLYHDSALKDKERYMKEMKEYKERMKLMPPKEFTRAEPSSQTEVD